MAEIAGIDSVIFIYLLEKNEQYFSQVKNVLGAIEKGLWHGVMSSIGLIEILTGPKKQDRFDIAAYYRDSLSHFPNLTIAGMNAYIVDMASTLRARYNIGTADAIHLATAIDFGASKFITNDKSLKKVKEITVELI